MYIGLMLPLALVATAVYGHPLGDYPHNAIRRHAPLAIDKVDQSIQTGVPRRQNPPAYHGSIRKQAPFAKRLAIETRGRIALAKPLVNGGLEEEPVDRSTRKHQAEIQGRKQSVRGFDSRLSEPHVLEDKPPTREVTQVNALNRDSSPVQRSGMHSPNNLDSLSQGGMKKPDNTRLGSVVARHGEKGAWPEAMNKRGAQEHRVKRGARAPDYKTTDVEEGPSSTHTPGTAPTDVPSSGA